jgi:hypothetical protein
MAFMIFIGGFWMLVLKKHVPILNKATTQPSGLKGFNPQNAPATPESTPYPPVKVEQPIQSEQIKEVKKVE